MQVWLKPDVLDRLDAYCAFYGVGRGRAIGHLLKGALPDPSWIPASAGFLEDAIAGEALDRDAQADDHDGNRAASDQDPELTALIDAPRPVPLFRAGERVCNNSGGRMGVIAEEPRQWVAPVRLATGALREGHWTYAVAWDGQMGLTIRYAEDLLRPVQLQRMAG